MRCSFGQGGHAATFNRSSSAYERRARMTPVEIRGCAYQAFGPPPTKVGQALQASVTLRRTVPDVAPGVRVMTNEALWVSGPKLETFPCWTGPTPSSTMLTVSRRVQAMFWISFWAPGLVVTETV